MLYKLNYKISSTGYRLFILLQYLMQNNRTKAEIYDYFNEHYKELNMNSEILRLDINTLRSAGFNIITGKKKDDYKYFLDWNPFKINFTKSELKILNQIKLIISQSADLGTILNLYKLFGKISKFINDNEQSEEFLNFGYLQSIDTDILNQLLLHCKNKNTIQILYKSPNQGNIEIIIKCQRISYDNHTGKVYLWGISEDYNNSNLCYLRVERILKIIKDVLPNKIKSKKTNRCTIRLTGESFKNYVKEDDDIILNKTENYIELSCKIQTEFFFLQRILSYGPDCVYIEDKKIKAKILEKLYEMRKIYQ